MLYRFGKWFAHLSSAFIVFLLLELTLAGIDPGATRSIELYSRLMQMKQDAKQHVRLQLCLITTRFIKCPSQETRGRTPTITSGTESQTNSPVSTPTPEDSSQQK